MSEQRERMEITSSTLSACPFCGGQPKATRLMGYDYWKTEITCCGFTGVDYDDVIEKRWNTRKANAKVRVKDEPRKCGNPESCGMFPADAAEQERLRTGHA